MLSLFLFLAPPPREEAKRRKSNPECVSPLRPGIRSGYTRISRRRRGARRVRSPCQRGYLIKQPERSCCCSQLLFFTLFYEASEPRHATSRAIVPVEAVSPPT